MSESSQLTPGGGPQQSGPPLSKEMPGSEAQPRSSSAGSAAAAIRGSREPSKNVSPLFNNWKLKRALEQVNIAQGTTPKANS